MGSERGNDVPTVSQRVSSEPWDRGQPPTVLDSLFCPDRACWHLLGPRRHVEAQRCILAGDSKIRPVVRSTRDRAGPCLHVLGAWPVSLCNGDRGGWGMFTLASPGLLVVKLCEHNFVSHWWGQGMWSS